MNFLSLFLLSITTAVFCSKRVKTDSKDRVLSDKKLILKIAAYLDNPYKNLAKVSKGHWSFFRQITPGPLLADRLNNEDALALTEFNYDAKFFFNLNRSNYLQTLSPLFFERKRVAFLGLSAKAKRILILGAYQQFMRDESDFSPSYAEIFLKNLFCALLGLNEFNSAHELFLKYKTLDFPGVIVYEETIHGFLQTFPTLTHKVFSRFKDIHTAFIFSYLLSLNLSVEDSKKAFQSMQKAFLLGSDTQFSHLVSQQITDKFIKYLTLPVSAEVVDNTAYHRGNDLITWISKKCQLKDIAWIPFVQDLNLIRFKAASARINVIGRMTKKWTKISAGNHCETILAVCLQTRSLLIFLTALKSALLFPISPDFKFLLRQHPDIIRDLSLDDLLKLHANDQVALFETLGLADRVRNFDLLKEVLSELRDNFDKVESALIYLRADQLKELGFNFEQYFGILTNVSSGLYKLDSDKRCAFISELLSILSSKIEEKHTGTKLIKIEEQVFMNFMREQASIDILKKIEAIGMFWRIEAKTLKNLLLPEHDEIFRNLHYSLILNYVAFNFYELVPLIVDVDDWINKLCPLFNLNTQIQFELINGVFWPQTIVIERELDSVLDGQRPILDFVNRSDSWNILPRLAHNSVFKGINTTSLLRLWSRSCLMTFIMFIPEKWIHLLLKKTAVIEKWLMTRPNDLEFKMRFASVYLDESVSIKIESSNITDLRRNYLEFLPFINSLKNFNNAKIEFPIDWSSILAETKDFEDLKEVLRIVSLSVIVDAFEKDPRLRTEYPYYYNLLFDFDFVCDYVC